MPISAAPSLPVVPIGADQCRNDLTVQAPNGTQRHPSAPIGTENIFSERTWFLPTQLEWIHDPYPLRIWEKSRQVGATNCMVRYELPTPLTDQKSQIREISVMLPQFRA